MSIKENNAINKEQFNKWALVDVTPFILSKVYPLTETLLSEVSVIYAFKPPF